MRNTLIGATLVAVAGLAGGPALAQATTMDHADHMGAEEPMDHDMGPMTGDGMDHDAGAMNHAAMAADVSVREPGQGAFAAIAEIVARLSADPGTDWSSVDIDSLRAHLVDMDLVTTRSSATSAPIDGGMRFTVTGESAVVGAVQRMVLAHAAIMNGVGGWHLTAQQIPQGAVLEVRVPEIDSAKLAGLGFYGVLALGMHHQAHHWAMATGQNPHM